tara:strand:+ start:104 stop:574 length:471 start_codon:yes stop_codon:yes gene_type:complete
MRKFFKFYFYIYISLIISYPLNIYSEQKGPNKTQEMHRLPINNNIINNKNKELKPFPLYLIEVVAKEVDSNRNPFSSLEKSKGQLTLGLKNNFVLTGIIQSNSILNALLLTKQGTSIYKEGDIIDNKTLIKKISLKDESITIVNDEKEYVLYLNKK